MDFDVLRRNVLEAIKKTQDVKGLEQIRIKYLGRQDGELIKILRSLKDLSVEEKRKLGPAANFLRNELEAAFINKLENLKLKIRNSQSNLDVTLPGKKVPVGHLHPLTLMENRIREIFQSLSFSVVEGPEVESDYYNFDALNIPANHPARDMWDTFWLRQKVQSSKFKVQSLLLRTHTSPVQIRYMEKHQPPFQIIVPGRVFRYEATDATHEINFHQIEGLMVGEDVSLANFKYIIEEFLKQLFGKNIHFRFRPSYFPFTEPSLEVDIQLGGKWLEVMGAGMVHPKVFDAVKYNSKEVRGFAFGLGLERLAMIKYKIDDIRLFYSGDLRFIKQF
ncbi:MAG: phenylalanine--tRNA ligase subunit alpha [Candidatus Harrisonbacteria bacterium RIFCSPLOWO2_02_FULL_41_13b]|uniref:Phenylalanine--tRNA ligase alpha subunit n=1 Tax=Candidatus Harrisonbacteria bacterium RIFCSPLOWO2_02_FULL_41_13b TaxID=1798409 RepID=A0A1G1ZRW5_9BACT|nr:MAG: phenylalanine--tRNA ligase subunit alpha [Candidatus Harrisonbacteria bacterium RIFCSPHIGHO2_02_FULL_40_20]OGY67483.1 MAG: phenylalanine--tRNA ligase subunit alpha [Candidatus Harrisonbacteria bacterium RIFCSPLOWO2_02_FULL_41_13b]